MNILELHFGDGILKDIDPANIIEAAPGTAVRLCVLPSEILSDEPSVGIAFDTPEGKTYLVETSWLLLQSAVKLFEVRLEVAQRTGF